jgi:hypothetical protein
MQDHHGLISSLSPATRSCFSLALLMRYSNSRPSRLGRRDLEHVGSEDRSLWLAIEQESEGRVRQRASGYPGMRRRPGGQSGMAINSRANQ